MDQERFRDWFTRVDDLTPAQRQEVSAALSGRPQGEDALAAIELGVDDERRCPHCASAGAVSRGKARGLRRYRCKACGKTFGALTGTALSGLHYKERWLSFGEALAEGETIVESAERCGIAPSTAFRWRHRFLKAVRQAPDRLRGIVEADETFVLESRKGERKLDRKPRRRGGKARKRGLSREQVPVLVAADRTGETLSCTLPILNAKSVTEALEPVLARDALLVSDANRCYPPVAAALDIPHETINRSAGERVRGAVHIQTVNSRHSQIKGFLRPFRGIATKYLDSYLRWFHLIELADRPPPRACLTAAMAKHAYDLRIEPSFMILMADRQDLYIQQGYHRVSPAQTKWLAIENRESVVLTERDLSDCFMVKPTRGITWPSGKIDMLGYLF